jgi:hypothetical protein
MPQDGTSETDALTKGMVKLNLHVGKDNKF